MHPDNADWSRQPDDDPPVPLDSLAGCDEVYRIVVKDNELHAMHVISEALARHCPSRAAKLRALRWAMAKAEETP